MLVVVRVALAFRGAGATGGQARVERPALRVGVGLGLAADDAPGVDARVRAVEAEPDAANQCFDVGSARHASAQIVHVAAHAAHSSMHAASVATSATSGRRCVPRMASTLMFAPSGGCTSSRRSCSACRGCSQPIRSRDCQGAHERRSRVERRRAGRHRSRASRPGRQDEAIEPYRLRWSQSGSSP